jgi:ribosomal protein S4
MNLSNRRRPKYKYFQRLRENISSNRKILKFKKKKWVDLIKRFTKSKKYKFFNHDLYHIPRKTKTLKNLYRSQLLTKQRLKLYYGTLSDCLLKNLSRKAMVKSKRRASETLLFSLEARLDTILYRSYFVNSINSAQQLIIHGNVLVNNRKITLSNFLLKRGDSIKIHRKGVALVKSSIGKSTFWPLPPIHLEINFKILSIYFIENIKFIHLSNCYSFWLNLKNVFSFYKT